MGVFFVEKLILLILHEFHCLFPTSYFLLSYISHAKIFNKDYSYGKDCYSRLW